MRRRRKESKLGGLPGLDIIWVRFKKRLLWGKTPIDQSFDYWAFSGKEVEAFSNGEDKVETRRGVYYLLTENEPVISGREVTYRYVTERLRGITPEEFSSLADELKSEKIRLANCREQQEQ